MSDTLVFTDEIKILNKITTHKEALVNEDFITQCPGRLNYLLSAYDEEMPCDIYQCLGCLTLLEVFGGNVNQLNIATIFYDYDYRLRAELKLLMVFEADLDIEHLYKCLRVLEGKPLPFDYQTTLPEKWPDRCKQCNDLIEYPGPGVWFCEWHRLRWATSDNRQLKKDLADRHNKLEELHQNILWAKKHDKLDELKTQVLKETEKNTTVRNLLISLGKSQRDWVNRQAIYPLNEIWETSQQKGN